MKEQLIQEVQRQRSYGLGRDVQSTTSGSFYQCAARYCEGISDDYEQNRAEKTGK